MNRIIYKFVAILMFALVGVVACDNRGVDDDTALADVQLSDIRDNLTLMHKLINGKDVDPEIKQNIAQSILKNLVLVRSLKPDINTLGGHGLETLCLLSDTEGRSILSLANNDELSSRANEYLDSIESSVKNAISDIQKDSKGKGCYITGGK